MNRLLVCILVCLASLSSGYAQQFNFYYPKSNTQLPQQFINDVCLGEEGYMYIATGEGISKFNGSDHVALEKPSGTENFNIKTLYYHRTLWAGNSDGELFYWTESDAFEKVEGATETAIKSLTVLNNTIWVLDGNNLYTVETGKLVKKYQLGQYGMPNAIHTLKGKLYLSSDDGFYVFEDDKESFRALLSDPICASAVDKEEIFLLAQNQLISYNGTVLNPIRTTDICDGFTDFYDIKKTEEGIWLASGDGLLKVPSKSGMPIQRFTESNGLLSSAITGLVAYNNSLWLGSAGKGLCFFQPKNYFYWYSTAITTSSKRTSAAEGVKSVSSEETNLHVYTHKNEVYTKDTTFYFDKIITATAIIGGNIYVGFEDGTVQIKYPSRSFIPYALPAPIPPRPIKRIYVRNAQLFLCVLNNGVYVLDNQNKLTQHYTTANGLPHNDVQKLLFSADKIWFISKGTGICYLQNNRFHYFTLQNGLPSLEITDATFDRNNNVWLSTEGAGAVKINSDKTIEAITITEGLTTNYLYGILINQNNQLVTLGRSVIDVIDLETGANFSIGLEERIKTGYGLPSGISNLDNQYGFLTDEGLLFANLTNKRLSDSKMVMKQALYDNTNQLSEQGELAYGDYKVSLEPDIINLDVFSSSSYEYQMRGFDKEWQPFTSTVVAYQSIKDGDYEFVVRKSSTQEEVLNYTFKVKTPFWKQPLFFIAVVILLAFSSVLYTRYRTKRLQEENRILEEKVQERTKELVQKNKELEQFSYAMSHDLKNPAINVSELVKILVEEMEEEDNDVDIVVEQLVTASDKMLSNLYNLIEVLKYANAGELPKEEIDIQGLVEDVKETLSKNIAENNAQIVTELEGFTALTYNRQNFQSIVYNLVSNGIKYRSQERDPIVTLKTYEKDGYQCMSISDNGMGIDMQKHGNKLFGMFNRLHNHVEGSGIGLHLIKGIIEKNGGTITADSALDAGTTFHIKLLKIER